MRRLSPALDGRLTRRAIVHSPHTWNVMAAVFILFALSDLALALRVADFEPGPLFVITAYGGALGIIIALTRPPERGSLGSHLVVAGVYIGISLAVWSHAPQGSGPVITGVFIPVLIALWITERHHAAAHLVAAWGCLLVAALSSKNDSGALVAVLCFIPASALLLIVCTLVLDAVEAQGEALDALALRDPLTGVGNRRMLESELGAELTRSRSLGRDVAVVELGLRDFQALNEHVGRAAGDAVLAAIASALTARAPQGATVARLEADRFVVVLPDSGEGRARAFIRAVRGSVPTHAGTRPLTLTSGIATLEDGGSADDLIAAAHASRVDDPGVAKVPDDGAGRPPSAPWTLVLTGLDLAPPPQLPRRVSRRDIARDRLIWRILGAAILFYAAALTAGHLMWPELQGDGLPYVAAVAVAFGLSALLTPPPRIGSLRNHVAVASAYLLPFAAMVTARPHTSWLVGAGILAPLLASVRLTDRRQVLAHLGMATALYVGLAVSGEVDRPGVAALMALSLNTWVLGLCTTVVMEAAETQWAQIEALLLRDPLTGAGNADLVRQRLGEELPRHDALQLPLALLELDLDGFDDLLRRDGRGTANQVLRDAAQVIAASVGPQATVARISGSTFRILLPLADVDDLSPDRTEALREELRSAVASIARRGRTILPRVGIAVYPDDGHTVDVLERVAGERRAAVDARGVGPAIPAPAPAPAAPAPDRADRRHAS